MNRSTSSGPPLPDEPLIALVNYGASTSQFLSYLNENTLVSIEGIKSFLFTMRENQETQLDLSSSIESESVLIRQSNETIRDRLLTTNNLLREIKALLAVPVPLMKES